MKFILKIPLICGVCILFYFIVHFYHLWIPQLPNIDIDNVLERGSTNLSVKSKDLVTLINIGPHKDGSTTTPNQHFIPTHKNPFPSQPSFVAREQGNCIINGDSKTKNLSWNCGCPPEQKPSPVHWCCRLHLLKLVKDVFDEMINTGIPFIITRRTLGGWLRDRNIDPGDRHINAALPYEHWYSKVYQDVLKRLSSKGYCVSFNNPVWTKIWSNVMMIDVRPWSVVENSLYFAGPDKGNPYKVSHIFPIKRVTLQGMYVSAPNQPKEYLNRYHGQPIIDFVPSIKQPFPRNPKFRSRELGNCKDNGDSHMKGLSNTCGCPPEISINHKIHSCCRKHLLKLIKSVFKEVIAADIPMILTGGALIGWARNKKLVPYDEDVDAGLEYKYWESPEFSAVLEKLASQGFCVWLRSPVWTKIWSTVVAFDLFAFNIVDNSKVVFWSPIKQGPYNLTKILPRRLDVLEGIDVFIPRSPNHYLDNMYGKGKWIQPWYQ